MSQELEKITVLDKVETGKNAGLAVKPSLMRLLREGRTQTMSNYTLELKEPSELKTAYPNIIKCMDTACKRLGLDEFESRLDVLLLEWALQSGFYYEREGSTLKFTHVSLR